MIKIPDNIFCSDYPGQVKPPCMKRTKHKGNVIEASNHLCVLQNFFNKTMFYDMLI